jgi:murein DD-endopeptidase MepM/ murein hydrolase activator NlpD
MRRGPWIIVALAVLTPAITAGSVSAATVATTGTTGGWTWPVVGPVIQTFDPPNTPYGSGHRGIDIAAAVGTTVVSSADGTVTFAGPVGGYLFLTIDHGGGLSSTYSWLSAKLVRKGDRVLQGEPVALTGWGHPGGPIPHVHLGVKLDGAYVDPLSYLGPISLAAFVRLAPFD